MRKVSEAFERKVGSFLSKEDKTKLAFQLFLIACLGIASGVIFSKFVSAFFRASVEQAILIHFELPFRFVSESIGWIVQILRYAWDDVSLLFLLFLFSFTLLELPLSELILLWQGGKLGFSVALLMQTAHSSTVAFQLTFLKILSFILLHCVVLMTFLVYIFRGAQISFLIRSNKKGIRFFIEPALLLRLCVETLVVCGSVLLLYGIYCFVIFML